MQYKIIVDKQSRINPSEDKKEYIIDIEELRVKGDVYDNLVITKDEDYVIRRLELTEFQVLNILDEPKKEPLENLNIELFEGDNYIYLVDMTGNKFYAEYILKNEFNDIYTTKAEFNSAIQETARSIELSVNQKLESYSTTEEIDAKINLKAGEITQEVNKKVGNDELGTKITQNFESVQIAWNKISEFIQFINAELQIKDNAKKLLMALNKLGMHFYKSSGEELGDIGIQDNNVISFTVMNEQGSMAWGIKYTNNGETDFYPVFSFNGKMVTDEASESSGYGFEGYFDFEAPVRLSEHPIYLVDENGASIQADLLGNLFLSFISSIVVYDANGLDSLSLNFIDKTLNLFGLLQVGSNVQGGYSFDFNNNSITNVENVANTDTINWLSSGNNYLYVSNKDGTYFSLWANSSDKKLKKNIKPTKVKALNKIKQIRHKEFDWKSNGEHQEIGYIAQEIQKIDPTFVHCAKIKTKDGEKEDWQINVLNVLSTTTKAIQEQQEQIETQQKQIEELLSRIEKLEARDGNN